MSSQNMDTMVDWVPKVGMEFDTLEVEVLGKLWKANGF